MNRIDKLIEELCPEGVHETKVADLYNYLQPTKYLVSSTEYVSSGTPVLTAGQSFLLGYTDEVDGIYSASEASPVILFDDFTTSFKWVDFPFKVKSSAAKFIRPNDGNAQTLRFLFHWMGSVGYQPGEHSRQWISKYSQLSMPAPPKEIQKEIVTILDNLDSLVNSVNEGIPAEIEARRKQYEHYRDKLLTFKELESA